MDLVAADVSPLKLKEVRADSRRLLRAGRGSWSYCMRQSERKLSMNRNVGQASSLPASATPTKRSRSQRRARRAGWKPALY